MAAPLLIEADPVLGSALGHYPSDRLPPLIVAGVIGAPALVILNFTVAAIPEWWSPIVTILITAALGLALGWYILHIWNREIILYERGFSYREGSQIVFMTYAEIRSIRVRAERRVYFGGLLRRNVYRFTVTTNRDEQFTITNLYRRAAELGSLLTEQINATLRPALAHRLSQGERVAFSDTLELSGEGLHENGRTLEWTGYGGYKVANRQLALLDSSSAVWFALPLWQVDNITLLLDLLKSRLR
jgi:uncharacterized membrane protein YobD (UPF0266 family)